MKGKFWIILVAVVGVIAIITTKQYQRVPGQVWKFLGFLLVMGIWILGLRYLYIKIAEKGSWN